MDIMGVLNVNIQHKWIGREKLSIIIRFGTFFLGDVSTVDLCKSEYYVFEQSIFNFRTKLTCAFREPVPSKLNSKSINPMIQIAHMHWSPLENVSIEDVLNDTKLVGRLVDELHLICSDICQRKATFPDSQIGYCGKVRWISPNLCA